MAIVLVIIASGIALWQERNGTEVSASSSLTSFSFAAAGDWGFNPDTQAVISRLHNDTLNFTLALGDLSYGQVNESTWCQYFKARVNNVEVIAGNHDSGETSGGSINNFTAYCPFTLGTVTGTYGKEYYFDYPVAAPLARFILTGCGLRWVVDGGATWACSVGDPHYMFVKAAIEAARNAGIRYVIVGVHKDCITTAGLACEIGQDFWDLLTFEHVDLILQGHTHTYERSKQLACAARTVFIARCVVSNGPSYGYGNGSVAIITGTGGGAMDPLNATDPNAPYFTAQMGTNTPGWGHGYTRYVVSSNNITGQFVNVGGAYTDSFSIGGTPPAPLPPPLLGTDFTFSPSNPQANQNVTFTASANLGKPPYSFAWNFGDGNTSSGPIVTHAYKAAATYTVALTTTDSANQTLGKTHTVTVSALPPPPPPPPANGTNFFIGYYYAQLNFTYLKFIRNDSAINFSWAGRSPGPGINGTSWSARWLGNWSFAIAGSYQFTAKTDDGMRIWIDGVLVLNQWRSQNNIYTFKVTLTAGVHFIRVDYYQGGGGSKAIVYWAKL